MDSANQSTNGCTISDQNSLSLFDIYNYYFKAIPSTTPDLLETSHNLRYKVYCIENKYEPINEKIGPYEVDAYDYRSYHSVLIHKPSGIVAGTVRLITSKNLFTESLPVIDASEYMKSLRSFKLPIYSTGEISRFSISKEFRKSVEEEGFEIDRTILSHITIGLFKALFDMCEFSKTTHLCAAVEPSLLRLLGRSGITFYKCGPVINFHGKRQPVYNSVLEILRHAKNHKPDVWEIITNKKYQCLRSH